MSLFKIIPGVNYAFLAVLFFYCSTIATAQNTSLELTAEALDQQIVALDNSQALTEVEKTEARDLLTRAFSLLRDADDRSNRIDQFVAEAENVDTITAQLAADISAAAVVPELPAGTATISTIRSQLALVEAELATANQARNQLRSSQTTLAGRSSAIAEEISTATVALEQLQQASVGQPSPDLNALDNARRMLDMAQRDDQQRLLQDLQRELGTIPSRQTLMTDRLSLAEARINNLGTTIIRLNGRLSETIRGRAEVARTSAESNIQRFAGSQPSLEAMAQENLNLANQLEQIVTRNPIVERETRDLQQQSDSLRQSQELVNQILATGSQTDELGELMRNVRSSLPRLSTLRQSLSSNDESRVSFELNQILWRNRLQRLANTTESATRVLTNGANGAAPVPPEDITEGMHDEAVLMLEQRLRLLEDLIQAAQTASDRLADQAIALNETLLQSENLSEILDRRLLWLRNSASHPRNLIRDLPQGFAWLLNPNSWQTAVSAIFEQAIANPLIALFAILIPLLTFRQKPRLKQRMNELAELVGKVGRDTYLVTPEALLICVFLAIPLPLLIGASGALLALTDNPDTFSQALVPSLTSLSSLLFIVILFRQMARPAGVFETHFNWSPSSRRNLRRHLFWFGWLEGVAAFIFTMAISTGDPTLRFSIALFAFVIGSAGLALLSFQFFRPKGGIIADIIMETPATSVLKVIFPLLVAVPLILGIIPLFGYFDTAVALQTNVFISGIILLGSAIVFGLAMRLFMIGHRRLALRKAREKRAKLEAERASTLDAEASGEAMPTSVEVAEVDVGKISAQIRNTLYALTIAVLLVGLWATWNALLPALFIADDVVLWQSISVIDGVESINPITLWDIVLFVLFLFGGILAARNIRGFLEVGVFSRTKLDAGARYAAVTIAGYILVATGFIVGFSQLGIDWSRLQWIIAALGVGLGFGLQEIVANFVSGLIILFERPVRVGDVVTIGNLSGTVSNIRIRATAITDFDNHEVLLPNKTIITENVVNWTLTDAVTRVVIRIGVAYGSDITLVHQLMMKAITAHPDVMSIPPPTVFFLSHGESSLDFEIRVFVAQPTKRLPVTHDVNLAINTILAENNIEIPFPQRDIHIKSSPEPQTELK